jgi:hypothetical protein
MSILRPENNDNTKEIKQPNHELWNQSEKNNKSEDEKKKYILGKLDMAAFVYVDMKKNEYWEYEVAKTENIDKEVFSKIEWLSNTLSNTTSILNIEKAFKNAKNESLLSPKELIALNYFKNVLRLDNATSENYLNRTSDVNPNTKSDSTYESLISFRDELLKILKAGITLPLNVAEKTKYILSNASFWLKNLLSELISDSKEKNDIKFKRIQEMDLKVINQIQDKKTWFSAILFEKCNINELNQGKTSELTLWIRWTDDFTDILFSDARLHNSKIINKLDIFDFTKWIPKQMITLIDFIEKNERIKELRKNNWKLNLVGHSLWWALSQILNVMYPWLINENHTFNSPWIKHISPILNSWDTDRLLNENKPWLINKIRLNLETYKNNINKPIFWNVLNIINHDEISKIWVSDKWEDWHIWIITERIPWEIHGIEWLRNGVENLSPSDFNRYILKRKNLTNKNDTVIN